MSDPDEDDRESLNIHEKPPQPVQVGWWFSKSGHLACIGCVTDTDAGTAIADTELNRDQARCDLCGASLESLAQSRGRPTAPESFDETWARRLLRQRAHPTTPEELSDIETTPGSITATLGAPGKPRLVRKRVYETSGEIRDSLERMPASEQCHQQPQLENRRRSRDKGHLADNRHACSHTAGHRPHERHQSDLRTPCGQAHEAAGARRELRPLSGKNEE